MNTADSTETQKTKRTAQPGDGADAQTKSGLTGEQITEQVHRIFDRARDKVRELTQSLGSKFDQ